MTTVTAQQVVDILESQPLSVDAYRTIFTALEAKMNAQDLHASWCDHDVHDDRLGRVCTSEDIEFSNGTTVGAASIDGRVDDYTIAVDVEVDGTLPSLMLILKPEDWRTAIAIFRAAPTEVTDTVEKLLQVAAEAGEVVR